MYFCKDKDLIMTIDNKTKLDFKDILFYFLDGKSRARVYLKH